jgi:homotetrameric cytidine deaminase
MERGLTTLDDLVASAVAARNLARAPYSRFAVGAAVVDRSGRVIQGCNVENASYGLTICAERVALFNAIVAGLADVEAIAVVVDAANPVSPCGACRQVMYELCVPSTEVVLATVAGKRRMTTVGSLLPEPFSARDLTDPAT